MKPRTFSSKAIVLGRRNYGEADRIVRLFTRDYGKVSLIAKGVRRPKSRKKGALEVFSLLKFSGVRGKGFDIMTEAEIVNNFSNIREDLKKVSVAYFYLETIDKLTRDEEENIQVFDLIRKYLIALDKSGVGTKTQRMSFIKDTLTVLGYWPDGKKMAHPDKELEKAVERQMGSKRVGKKVLS